jgi:transcriptional regulator with XRE-family HTH domain
MSPQHPAPTLIELLERKGASKAEFSEAIKVAVSTSRRWRTGEVIPSVPKALESARYLGCSLKTFFRAIGQDVSGIPDDLPEISDRHDQDELNDDLQLVEAMLSETTATLAKLRQYRTRIKRKMG